ncbi:hypothetical protein DBV15_11383 [Temnothorax longispinosus]|uniref:Uncharacterized protein n=1 Tax=Temnothorax longispinosus TaxID=300112 RepID=A0A4S2KV04_9HYME|nr:hypothetical protein DBV15_11383 [Temnothorax longispinosus]
MILVKQRTQLDSIRVLMLRFCTQDGSLFAIETLQSDQRENQSRHWQRSWIKQNYILAVKTKLYIRNV